jgi:hypothetical protein
VIALEVLPNHSLQSDRANRSVDFLCRFRKVVDQHRVSPAAKLGRYALGTYKPNIAAVLLLPLTTISIVILFMYE